jgi:uncharacterized protein YaeQ
MAAGTTVFHFEVTVSDVDRSVYETLSLRLARHPSETNEYLITRALAYALLYEEGITFSKGGLSSSDEPGLSVVDLTGTMQSWIDVGAPSAERLHRASKATPRVHVVTSADPRHFRRELSSREVHRAGEIQIHRIDAPLITALAARVERHMDFEVARNEGQLYVTLGGQVFEGTVNAQPLDSFAHSS